MIHISFENSTNMNLKEDCFPQARKGGGSFHEISHEPAPFSFAHEELHGSIC